MQRYKVSNEDNESYDIYYRYNVTYCFNLICHNFPNKKLKYSKNYDYKRKWTKTKNDVGVNLILPQWATIVFVFQHFKAVTRKNSNASPVEYPSLNSRAKFNLKKKYISHWAFFHTFTE